MNPKLKTVPSPEDQEKVKAVKTALERNLIGGKSSIGQAMSNFSPWSSARAKAAQVYKVLEALEEEEIIQILDPRGTSHPGKATQKAIDSYDGPTHIVR